MPSFEAVVYLLCIFTSGLCAYLLIAGFRRSRDRLLLWSSLCFCLLAVNNLFVFIDIVMLPSIDLSVVRSLTSLAAVGVLLYAFIWEIE